MSGPRTQEEIPENDLLSAALDGFPDLLLHLHTYLGNSGLKKLSKINRNWNKKTNKYLEQYSMYHLVQAVLCGDESKIIYFLKLYPEFLFVAPNTKLNPTVSCPLSKRQFDASLTIWQLATLNNQFRTIHLLTYFMDQLPNPKAAKKLAAETWVTTSASSNNINEFNEIIDLIKKSPIEKDIWTPSAELNAKLVSLKNSLHPKKPLNASNYIDVTDLLVLAHQAYTNEIAILTTEQRNYFYLHVIHSLHQCMPPELVNVYLTDINLLNIDKSMAHTFSCIIPHNFKAWADFYQKVETNKINKFAILGKPELIRENQISFLPPIQARTIEKFKIFMRLKNEGLNEIKENLKNANNRNTEEKKVNPLIHTNEFDDATGISEDDCVEAITLNPTDYVAIYKLALLCITNVLNLPETSAARANNYLRRCLELNPNYIPALLLQIKISSTQRNQNLGSLIKELSDLLKNPNLNSKLKSNIYTQRALLHSNLPTHTQACFRKSELNQIWDYHRALKLNPNNVIASHNLNTLISQAEFHDSTIFRIKYDYFIQAKDFPLPERKEILLTFLDPTSQIGSFFWNKRTFNPCVLKRGTLKDICDYLFELEHDNNKPTPYNSHSESELKLIIDEIEKQKSFENLDNYYLLLGDAYFKTIATTTSTRPYALKNYNEAIKINPKNAIAYLKRGEVYLEHQPEQALIDFNQAISLNPYNISAYQARVRVHMKNQHIGAAIYDYCKILQLNPNADWSKTCLDLLFRIYTKNEIFSFIQKLSPEQQLAVLNQCLNTKTHIGILFNKKEELTDKLTRTRVKHHVNHLSNIYEQELQKIPESTLSKADFYFERGNTLSRLGHDHKALDAYTYVISLTPDNLSARMQRSKAYTKIGNFKAAIDDYNFIISRAPENNQAYLERAQIYLKQRKFKKCIADLTYILNKNPKDSVVISNILLKAFREKYALNNYHHLGLDIIEINRSLARNPNQPEFKEFLGHLINFKIDPEFIRQFLSLDKNTRINHLALSLLFDPHTPVGKIFHEVKMKKDLTYVIQEKNFNQMKKSLFTTIRISSFPFKIKKIPIIYFPTPEKMSENPDENFNLGLATYAYQCFKVTYRKIHSYTYFNKAIELKPDHIEAYFARAHASDLLENTTGAISDFTHVITLDKNRADAFDARGAMHYKLGQKFNALYDWYQAQKISKENNPRLTIFLQDEDKENIFELIKQLSLEKQRELLRDCLTQATQLGRFFWQARGKTACGLDKGMLKQICDYLVKIDPTFTIPTSVSLFSLFKPAQVELSDIDLSETMELGLRG